MSDSEGSLVVLVMVGLALGFLISLTPDNVKLDLKAIETMSKMCENNGGLDYIEHDYDVKCKNGASFEFDRVK